MKTRNRTTCLLAFVFAGTGGTGNSTVHAQSTATIPGKDCKTSLVRVYFTDKLDAGRLFVGFEGAVRETNYSGGYHIMAIREDQRDLLTQSGRRVEDVPTEISTATSSVRATRAAQAPVATGAGIPYQSPTYSCFRTVDETFATARQLVAGHPNLANWVDVGDSWIKAHGGSATDPTLAGDDMMVLVLTNSAVGGNKPRLFITSSVHADEIAPMELSTRFAEYLVENFGIDADVTWILDHNEIHLLLASNPDSRRLSETGTSARKNRNDSQRDEYCDLGGAIGVDINRNFTYSWGHCEMTCLVSAIACDFGYQGAGAGSEPETQAIMGRLQQLFGSGASGIYVDLHSYSELVLWPWGYTTTPPSEASQLRTLGFKMASYNNYYPEPNHELYGTSGSSTDYAYGALGVPAFTIEVGKRKWEDCAYFEADILPRNLKALIYAAKAARDPYRTPAGPGVSGVVLGNTVVLDSSAVALTAVLDDREFGVLGIEPGQTLAAAEYYVDRAPWESGAVAVAMAATDGTFGCRIDRDCASYAALAEKLAGDIVAATFRDKLADDPCKNPGQPPAGAPDPSWYVQQCQEYLRAIENLQEPVGSTVETARLSVGRHRVYLRGKDSDGNWGPISAAFLTKTTRGDVNADGRTDIVDALLIAQSYVDLNPAGFYREAGDVDCDGAVTIVDALMVAQYYVGVIAALPTCGS